MKKLLPLSCLFILFIFSGYSQVVDITGKGIKGIKNSNLQILDRDFIERVEVGAFYKGGKTTPDIDAVLFQTTNSGPSSNFNDDIITKLSLRWVS